MLIGVVALIVVGPQRLPGMMATVGKWSSKLRRMLFDVRQQSGIDDILRAEGITGGLNEIRALRNAVRGNVSSLTQALTSVPKPAAPNPSPTAAVGVANANPNAVSPGPLAQTALAAESDPYANVPYDRSREYPDEGCDAYGAIPDDLWAASRRPHTVAEPVPDPVVDQTTDGSAVSPDGSAAIESAITAAAVVADAAETDAAATGVPATQAPASDVDASPGVAAEVDAQSTATDAPPSNDASSLPSATDDVAIAPTATDVATDEPAQANSETALAEAAPNPAVTPLEPAATAQPTSPSFTASSAS